MAGRHSFTELLRHLPREPPEPSGIQQSELLAGFVVRRVAAEVEFLVFEGLAILAEGFAHGFVVLSESAEFLYKTTDYYAPEHERSLLWNDPALGIQWPIDEAPQLSAKDQAGKLLRDAELFP